jgi:hypothetical protein
MVLVVSQLRLMYEILHSTRKNPISSIRDWWQCMCLNICLLPHKIIYLWEWLTMYSFLLFHASSMRNSFLCDLSFREWIFKGSVV